MDPSGGHPGWRLGLQGQPGIGRQRAGLRRPQRPCLRRVSRAGGALGGALATYGSYNVDNELGKSTIFHGKIHYFDWAMASIANCKREYQRVIHHDTFKRVYDDK